MVVFKWLFAILISSGAVFGFYPKINNVYSSKKSSLVMFEESRLVDSLIAGTQFAREHCQRQFQWDRWNCPESAFTRKYTHALTKEAAFVRAIISAGLMHTLIQNCTRGQLLGCGCQVTPTTEDTMPASVFKMPFQSNYKDYVSGDMDSTNIFGSTATGDTIDGKTTRWADCTMESMEYAEKVLKKYLDDVDIGAADIHSYLFLHNNAAGRMAVKSGLTRRCRCHVLTGSCTVQTCWLELAPFDEVATYLRLRYNEATRIDFAEGSDRISIGNSARAALSGEKPVTEITNLIYLDESPDYCVANTSTGWVGTAGRTCSRNRSDGASVTERRSCKHLCKTCGLRTRKRMRTRKWRCECQFTWCCDVKCHTCTENVDEFFCD